MYRNLGSNAAKIADKRFGQNFLKDSSVLLKIIEAIPNNRLPIVEIGPGLGDLTKQLLKVGQVRAYEVDKRLCEYLKQEFKEPLNSGNLELLCKDILEHDGSLFDSEYYLVANLPYYIATKIILNALRDSSCKGILVMVQKEVAKKFSASCGDKNYGSLAILAQSAGDAKLLFDVPKEAFEPQPKVTSAILHIKKQSSLDDIEFEAFLKIATAQPRKTLYKNLSSNYAKDLLRDVFNTLGIKSTIRAHELELSKYHLLYKELKKDNLDESRREKTDTTSSRGE